MFAAAAAAAAIPKEISSPENSSPAEKCSKDEMSSQEITNTSTPVEAEAVAQAFLKSVDKYFEVNEFGQENNDDKKFGTGTAFAKDELSDIIGKLNLARVFLYSTNKKQPVVATSNFKCMVSRSGRRLEVYGQQKRSRLGTPRQVYMYKNKF